MSSSGTSSPTTQSGMMPYSRNFSPCAAVLGKPSSSHPLSRHSGDINRCFTKSMMRSSGTSIPPSMNSLALSPTSVPSFTAARSRSPVDKWTTPYRSTNLSHCVPLPDAGAPLMISFGRSVNSRHISSASSGVSSVKPYLIDSAGTIAEWPQRRGCGWLTSMWVAPDSSSVTALPLAAQMKWRASTSWKEDGRVFSAAYCSASRREVHTAKDILAMMQVFLS
mmetsp:Transcript_44106/g.109942  ORF Transcript_44106/g.109942 Transcript_44106/m.109942 type:complete len:222 (-) Transcript_44106:638-1303(-)